jgi:hypothetical protein
MALTWSPTRSHPFSPPGYHPWSGSSHPHYRCSFCNDWLPESLYLPALSLRQNTPPKHSYPSINLRQNTRIRTAAGPIVLQQKKRWCTCTAGSCENFRQETLANEKTHTDIGSTIVFFFKEHPFHDLSRRQAPVAGAHKKVCVFGAWER